MNIQQFFFNVCYHEGIIHAIVQLIKGMQPVQFSEFSFYFAVVATCSHRLPNLSPNVVFGPKN